MNKSLQKLRAVLIITLIHLLISPSIWAQAPQSFKYQAVLRDNAGQIITSQNTPMRISVLQNSPSGTLVYQETFNPTTNTYGLVNLYIGAGTVVSGNFSTIAWNTGSYYIKVEVNTGSGYVDMGTTQLLSVPYAFHANTVDSISENDPVFSVSPANGITTGDITNWHTAHTWGNHDTAGYAPATHTHSATDITTGTLSIFRGGTGLSSYTPGNYINALNSSTLQQRTPAQVRLDIGAASAAHTHSAADIISGTLSATRGGTGLTSYTPGNYINALDASNLQQRTPTQVRADIGAASAIHTHGNITNDGKIGTAAGRLITTGTGGSLQTTAGTAPGQMLYWNGSSWVNTATGSTAQVLTYTNNVPTWVDINQSKFFNNSNLSIYPINSQNKIRIAQNETYNYGFYASMNTGSTMGYGGYFTNTSTATTFGVKAEANYTGTSNIGYTYGGNFVSNSTTQDGFGVYATANRTTSTSTALARGVEGRAFIAGSMGVAIGVRGFANNGESAYGLYGVASGASGTNYGVYCSGNGVYTGTWASASDIKLKKNIRPLSDALSKIMLLEPHEYEMRTAEFKEMHLAEGKQFGLIAQELEMVFPELVKKAIHPSFEKDGENILYKNVDYISMIPILIKAMQEQQQIIQEQQQTIDELKELILSK